MWGLRNQAHNHDVRIRIAPNSELWRLKMNRTVVSGIAAFALLIGAGLSMTDTTAEAGRCGGGLLSKLQAKSCGGSVLSNINLDLGSKSCSGGLLARLKAKHAADCCAPEPAPCAEPEPCATEAECCEKPCLLERLMSKLRRNKCCEDPCAEEAESSSDEAPAAPAAEAKADA